MPCALILNLTPNIFGAAHSAPDSFPDWQLAL